MRQTLISAGLALLILEAWLTFELYCLFFYSVSARSFAFGPIFILAICWLNVGLFIIAHDAMHGSLFPKAPSANLWAGQIALFLYAGFSFKRLKAFHFAHHRSPGSADDPDFDAKHPSQFWPWYGTFMRGYFGARQFFSLSLIVIFYLLAGARFLNLLLFFALPALLSSVQLFYFGTFLPHRLETLPFPDHHRARTSNFSWGLSLLTCFHFGYHHEHHLSPDVPWWGLPSEKKRQTLAR